MNHACRLHELSVANLTRLRTKPKVVLQASQAAVRLTLDGNLEASLLLVDHLWPQLADSLAGETIVAVPTRDCLVAIGTEVAGGFEALRQGVKRVWEDPKTNPKLVLTRSLLVRRGGAWQRIRAGFVLIGAQVLAVDVRAITAG